MGFGEDEEWMCEWFSSDEWMMESVNELMDNWLYRLL